MAMNMLERARPRSAMTAGATTLTADEVQSLGWPSEPPPGGDTVDNGPRTDLDGLRVTIPGDPALYLVDGGFRRWVPDPTTYDDLFPDWTGVLSGRVLDGARRAPWAIWSTSAQKTSAE